MIRTVLIGVVLIATCIMLYIPAKVPAERFTDLIRQEHTRNTEAWGPEAAERTLARMLELAEAVGPLAAPPPPTVQMHLQSGVSQQMATSIAAMSERFFNNSYFRSIDALLLLVAYRASAMVEMLPLLGCLAVLGFIDAMAVRQVRIRRLRTANAEVFALQFVGAIVLLAGMVVAIFLPVQLAPWMLSALPVVAVLALTRSLAQYHAVR